MRDLGPLPAEQDADNVEAEGLEIGCPLGEVLLGHDTDGALFAGRYGFEGGPVGGAAAEFHLDNDEGVGVARDQVKLSPAGAVVALHDLVSLAREVAARQLLAEVAGEAVAQAPTPA